VLLIIQPIGHTLKDKTTNGVRAYATWESLAKMDTRERELVLKFVEGMKNIAACSWHRDRLSGAYLLLLERRIDTKWAGDNGVASEVCGAIEEAIGHTFVLQVGPVVISD
jgi:hypothetical protein